MMNLFVTKHIYNVYPLHLFKPIFAIFFLTVLWPEANKKLLCQTVNEQALDGQLYVKIKDNIPLPQGMHKSRWIAKNVWQKYLPLPEKVGVSKVEASFYFASEDYLKRIFRVYFDSIHQVNHYLKLLQELPYVEYAEVVPLLRKTLVPNDLGGNTTSGTGQWFLHRINAQQAWDLSTGSAQVKVAVVDDAIQITHPDLMPNLVQGRDVADGDNDPSPPNNNYDHGTHVAGIVSAKTNNGIGVASIGFNIKIIPVKATNNPDFVTHGYEGITWARQNGADIINASWGSSTGGSTGQLVTNAAFNAGVIVVAAAGNDNVSTVFYPAGYANVISVASTTSNDTKSSFSNFGTWINISAPGSSIRSTTINSAYGFKSGTSMASPLVAGLIGLMKSVNPGLTPQQALSCLQSSATNINAQNPNFTNQLGAGRINAPQALQCVNATLPEFDAGLVNIIQPFASSCNSDVQPILSIRNFGLQTITSLTLNYGLGNTAQSFQWSGSIATGQTAQVTLPTINAPLGTNTFQASIVPQSINGNQTDANVNNNNNAKTFTILGSFGVALPFTENFESAQGFNLNGWTIDNPDNSLTWEIVNTAGNTFGSRSARIPFYSYQATGQRDGLISRNIDFTGLATATLTFRHAYRRYNTNSTDSLIVYITTDCGETYTRLLARGENGSGTFATTTISTENFVPAVDTDWCFAGTVGSSCYSINLTPYVGNPSVRIKFEGFNNYGNNLYLDDINLTGTLSGLKPIANFSWTQMQGVCEGSSVNFNNLSTRQPSSFLWSFPGGNPSSSTLLNPQITYAQSGVYPVTLIATNTFGSDTIVFENAIHVLPRPELQLSLSKDTICQGETVNISAAGASSYVWFPASLVSPNTGAQVTTSPSISTNYTVNATGENGCTSFTAFSLVVNPLPTIPVISIVDEVQLSTNAMAAQYQWNLNGVPIAGAVQNTHTVSENGLYSITITNQEGCSRTSQSVNISTVGIGKLSTQNWKVYPNPFNDFLVIECTEDVPVIFEIVDIAGRTIHRSEINHFPFTVSTLELIGGVYLIRCADKSGKSLYRAPFVK